MRDYSDVANEAAVWGPYVCCDDVARFEYGRRFWRIPQMRLKLLAHWLDDRHPHPHQQGQDEGRFRVEAGSYACDFSYFPALDFSALQTGPG